MWKLKKDEKTKNHLIPAFHIRKWIDGKRVLYNTKQNTYSELTQDIFFEENYYDAAGERELEDRISTFEAYVGKLIKKIDDCDGEVKLKGNDLTILKFYCMFCACRQEKTTEIILDDDFGMYRSNNYLFGVPRLTEKKEVISFVKLLLDEFDMAKKPENFNFYSLLNRFQRVFTNARNSIHMSMINLHLSIVRSENEGLLIGDVFAIIENTIDSDHLYTYIPMSPKTGFLLVKTKYYKDYNTLEYSKRRLASNNGGVKDPYLSVVFASSMERELICSYSYEELFVSIKPMFIERKNYDLVSVEIVKISRSSEFMLNGVMVNDSEYVIVQDKRIVDFANKNIMDFRHIELY